VRRDRVDAAHLRADELQLVAMLRVLRLAHDQLVEHRRGLLVLPARHVRLGQRVHRGEDVRLFVEARVERDEALERRRVAGVDAQHAVEELDRGAAIGTGQRFLGERRQHLQRLVGVAGLEVELREPFARGRIVGVRGKAAFERLLRAGRVALRERDAPGDGDDPRVVRAPFERRLHDLRGVLVVLRLEERGDQRLDQFRVAGVDLERLAEDLHRLVEHAALEQHPSDAVVLLQRVGGLVVLRVEVGELDVDVDRVRVELGDFAVDAEGVSGVAVLEVVVGQDLVLALRLHRQPLLRVEVGELGVDVELGGIELVDLLEDRDRFEEEAVARVVVGDLREDLDRFLVAVDADPEIADAIEGVDVVRVVVEEALVFLDRRFDLSFGDQLFGAGDDLIALNRHSPYPDPRLRTATWALRRPRTISGESGSGRTASARPDVLPSHTPGDA
jgi:hypothetical protein